MKPQARKSQAPLARFKPPLIAAATLAASLPALAHVSYTGRDFGAFSGLANASSTIANQATTGNYGWADATDADWGDSHKGKWFTFTLANAATVTITASAKANATATSIGGLIPAFSLYQGTAPITFDLTTGTTYLSYDKSTASMAYRASLGFAVEGVWNALGNFSIGNDAGVLGQLTYVGSALDGTGYLGDGSANGSTGKTFAHLAAGSYSIVVGGGDYLAQLAGNPDLASAYGMSISVGVTPVPEPQSVALWLAGGALVGMAARRGRQRQQQLNGQRA